MKKKLLIVTLNDYIVYQPTILNLYDSLQSYFDVKIISFEPSYISETKDISRNIEYLRPSYFISEVFHKADFVFFKLTKVISLLFPKIKYHFIYYNYYLPLLLKKALRKAEAANVIAVDIPALYICQLRFGSVHFLSLEIDRTDPFYQKVDFHKIKSVFIQNQMRFEYLFGESPIKKFFIQNAPVFKELYKKNGARKDMVWAGTILERFAVLDCVEFFNTYSQYRLVLKGGADKSTLTKLINSYSHLLKENRIQIDRDYLMADDFILYLSNFRIGFCFYSWELIHRNFNYQTAPSGKLFMYLAAGTPVIACDIAGFSFVKEFGAGVLISDYKPKTIKAAVEQIESNYEKFSNACYTAARHFSFDKAVQLYIDFLRTDTV